MSKLSKLSSGKSITPGQQIVGVISAAKPGGNAERAVREIAAAYHGSRLSRNFPNPWMQQDGVCSCEGSIAFAGNEYSLRLQIGSREGLVLEDVPDGKRSLRPSNGSMVLEVGQDLDSKQIGVYARNLVASWVVHGRDWMNRRQEVVRQPYGFEARTKMPDYFYFNVIDGAKQPPMTLQELIDLGCTRSTHVGEWAGRHSTLVAALCDMPLTMHEFKKGGEEICVFNGVGIGKDVKTWGPYCRWDEEARRSDALGIWKELAITAASPFAFHVHATRTLFPKARLDSDFLLDTVGRERLHASLALMAQKEPERFYRLIDESGNTHSVSGVTAKNLQFGSRHEYPLDGLAENVMTTFEQLQLLQYDNAYCLPRMVRVVLDPHSYIVLESLALQKKEVYALSGRDMHWYLTEGGSSNMHRVRNERLFLLLRRMFGVTSVDFHVHPPLSVDSGVQSQYGDVTYFNKAWHLAQKA